jgi:hypothetical protein
MGLWIRLSGTALQQAGKIGGGSFGPVIIVIPAGEVQDGGVNPIILVTQVAPVPPSVVIGMT